MNGGALVNLTRPCWSGLHHATASSTPPCVWCRLRAGMKCPRYERRRINPAEPDSGLAPFMGRRSQPGDSSPGAWSGLRHVRALFTPTRFWCRLRAGMKCPRYERRRRNPAEPDGGLAPFMGRRSQPGDSSPGVGGCSARALRQAQDACPLTWRGPLRGCLSTLSIGAMSCPRKRASRLLDLDPRVRGGAGGSAAQSTGVPNGQAPVDRIHRLEKQETRFAG